MAITFSKHSTWIQRLLAEEASDCESPRHSQSSTSPSETCPVELDKGSDVVMAESFRGATVKLQKNFSLLFFKASGNRKLSEITVGDSKCRTCQEVLSLILSFVYPTER